jgi:flagellar protein FliS
MSNQGANQYRAMQVKTASPGQLLILLYEACIQNVKKASDSIDRKDVPAKGKHIGKAHDIINELTNTLNFEVGGEVARELERLYNFMTTQLIKANIENSKEPLTSVQKCLETLLDGWKKAVAEVQKGSVKS